MTRLVRARRQSLASEIGSICGHSRGNHTHTCRVGKGQKPDIIDCFLVSTLIRPLLQKCEIVKSAPWDPHYGVKLTLSINFESVVSRQLIGKFSKWNRHNTTVFQGQSTQYTGSRLSNLERNKAQLRLRRQEASLPEWSGRHSNCMLPICSRMWFLGRGR